MSRRKLIIPNPITDDFILNLFITSKNKLNPNYIRDKWLDENILIKQYLLNRFNDNCSNISEIIYRIKNNIENIPICKMCNNPISFRGFQFGYSTYCSSKCAWKCDETFEKSRNSLLLKYGDENYGKFGSPSYKDKMKNKYGTEFPQQLTWVKDKVCKTTYNHYGVNCYFQTEKCNKECHSIEATKKKEETCMLHFGSPYYFSSEKCIYNSHTEIANNKRKQTCLEKYGVEYIIDLYRDTLYSDTIRNKIKQTCLEKYGVEYVLQSDIIKNKSIQTCLEKYGVEYVLQSDIIKNKSIQTCLEKYGVEYYQQTLQGKLHLSNIMKSKEVQNKINNTKKKNNSFHTSKIEQQFKEYLEQNYPNDFEYQYKSKLYPFNCDFYIKSLDLYIEIQGSWTHGKHPFDENNYEDINKLNIMKSKNTKYYQNAIYVWTKLDIKKRNIAKENNLNYLEIFSMDLNKCIYQLNEYIQKKLINNKNI